MTRSTQARQGWAQRSVVRLIEAPASTSPLGGALLVVTLLAASWGITYVAGGAGQIPPHLFYIPILVAAARFGPAGAATTALLAGVIGGPLLPLNTTPGTAQNLSDWVGRTGYFLGIGVLLGGLVRRLQHALAREREVTVRERALVAQKTTLIHTVSHEFRTPLTVVRGVSKTLRDLELVTGEGRALLDSLDRATTWLDDMVMELLAAGGALTDENAVVKTVSLEDLCRRVAERVGGKDAPGRLHLDLGPGAGTITHHGREVEIALRAVVGNALKFSPQSAPVDIRSRKAGDAVEVRVADRGPGVAPGFLEHVFEAFTQQDTSTIREKGGLGVGLFVARSLLERMGGSIRLEPRRGGGTEVVLTFP